MFSSLATNLTAWSLSSRYILRSKTDTLLHPSLIDCLFRDSIGLFVFGVASQSSLSLRVSDFNTEHSQDSLSITPVFPSPLLYSSDCCRYLDTIQTSSLKLRRFLALEGLTFPQRTSKILILKRDTSQSSI